MFAEKRKFGWYRGLSARPCFVGRAFLNVFITVVGGFMFKPVSPKLNVTQMEEGVLRLLEDEGYLP